MNIATAVLAACALVAVNTPTAVFAAGKAATDGEKAGSVIWLLAGVIFVTTAATNYRAMLRNSGDRLPWSFAFGSVGVACWVSLTNSLLPLLRDQVS